MRIGLNAGFGWPLAQEFEELANYAFQVARQDLYANRTDVRPLVAEFVGAPLQPLFLIGGGHIEHVSGGRLEPHELAVMTTNVVTMAASLGLFRYAIEIGNEPDIAHVDYSTRPQDFTAAIIQCRDAARSHGFEGPIISGGISNLNTRGLRYLAGMMDGMFPEDVVVGFHRYPEAGRYQHEPHQGFDSRRDEWELLMRLVGSRSVACTEFGYHTANSERTDDGVAQAVLWDLEFYAARAVLLACVFQLNDGPDDVMEQRYGVRAFDGTWKPVAEQIRESFSHH